MAIYELEDRIYFDGALPADIAEIEDISAQEVQSTDTAVNTDSANNDNSENVSIVSDINDFQDSENESDNDSLQSSDSDILDIAEITALETEPSSQLDNDIDAFFSVFENTDCPNTSLIDKNVLIVSTDNDNCDEILNSANENTIIITYDTNDNFDSIIQKLKDELTGNKAVNIGIINSDNNIFDMDSEETNNFLNILSELQYNDGEINLLQLTNNADNDIGTNEISAFDLSYDNSGTWVLSEDSDIETLNGYFDNESSLLSTDNDQLNTSNEIIFVDSSVSDINEIVEDFHENAEVVYLISGEDSIQQITDYLSDKTDIDTIRIVSHGDDGYLFLDGKVIDNDYVNENSNIFSQWSSALSENADIMIYSCNLAATTEGQELIQSIAAYTGADVAASVDSTGGDIYNGDWDLEYSVGEIEPVSLSISGDIDIKLATVTWTDGSGVDHNWNTAANWSGGVVPGAADDVVILDVSAINGPDVNGSYIVNSLTVQNGGVINFTTGISQIAADEGDINITGTGQDGNGAVIATGSNLISLIASTGDVTLSDAKVDSTNGLVIITGTNSVQVTGSTQIDSDSGVVSINSDTAAISGGGSLSIAGGTGTVEIQDDINGLASLTISSAAQVDLKNITTTGDISVAGTNIDLNGITYTSNSSIAFTGSVDLDEATGATITVTSGGAAVNDIIFSNTIDDTDSNNTLRLNAGAEGDIQVSSTIGESNSVYSLDFDGYNITIANIGDSDTVGVTNSTDINALNDLTFTGTIYKGNQQVYTAGASKSFMMNAADIVEFTASDDSITFNTGTIKLSDATNLSITSGGGVITIGDIEGTSDETVTLSSTGGTDNDISIGNLGASVSTGISTLSVIADDIITFTGTTVKTNGTQSFTSGDAADKFLINAMTTFTTTNDAVSFINGGIKLGDNCDLTVNAGTGTVSFDTDRVIDGTSSENVSITCGVLNIGAVGTITADGITDLTITISVDSSLSGNIEVNGTFKKSGTAVFSVNAYDITTSELNINAGTFGSGTSSSGTWNAGSVTIDAGATLNATSGSFTVSGNWSKSNTGVFNHNDQTVTFNGSSGTQLINSRGGTFYDVYLNGAASITFSDSVSIENSIYGFSAANIYFYGSLNSIAGNTIFTNSGNIIIGDEETDSTLFIGGLSATGIGGTVSIAGTVATTDTAMDLGAVTMTTNSTLKSGTGEITVASITDGASSFTLTLQENDAGSTGSVTFTGNVTLNKITTFAQNYAVTMQGSENIIDLSTNFINTGLTTIGDNTNDSSTFTGGLEAVSIGGIKIAGTVQTTNQQIDLGVTTVLADHTATVISGTAALNIGAVTLMDGSTLQLQNGGLTGGSTTVTSISGTLDGTKSNIAVNTTGTASIGAVGTDIGSVTVVQSSGVTFTSTLEAVTLTLADTTGVVQFDDTLTLTTGLITADKTYSVSILGSAVIAGETTFSNTGILTLGDGGTENIGFTGGLIAIASSSISIGAFTVTSSGSAGIQLGDSDTGLLVTQSGTIGGTGTGILDLGDLTIADTVTLEVGTGTTNAVNLDAVDSAGGGTGNITINTNNTVTLSGNIGSVTVLGTLKLTDGNFAVGSFDIKTDSLDIDGGIFGSGTAPSGTWNIETVDIASGSTLIATNGDFSVSGDWNINSNGIFDNNNGTVIFDGTAAQSINSGGTDSDHDFNNVTVSNTSTAVSVSSENLKVTGTLEISASAELSLDSGAQVWVSDGTFTETGDLTLAADSALINHNGITYDYYGGTTGVGKTSLLSDFDGTDNVTVKEGNFAQDEAAAALSLTVDSGAVYTVTTGNLDVGSGVTVNGTLTGANTIYVGGDWDNNGTFTSGTSTVVFDGASAQTLDGGGSAFNSLTVADDAAVSLITNDLTVSGTLSIGQGTSGSFDTNSKNVTAGGITIASGGVLNLDGTSGTSTLTLNGNITNNGNLTVENSTNAVSITGNTSRRSFLGNDIDYNANSITLTSIDYDPDVNLSVSGDKIVLGDGNCIFDSVTIGTGTEFDAGMNNFEISGNFSNSGTYTSSGNTVTFTGGNTTLDSGSSSFESVIINKELSTNTLTLQTSDLAVSNILGITSGELVQGNLNITVSDTGSTGTAVTVGSDGTWSNTGDGDVTLGGDVSNTGTVSFDGATALPDGIQIRSTVDGQQRNWQGSGTFSMTDVDVKDQTAIGGAPEYITVVSGTDSGNNVNWLFSGIESIGGTAYSDEGSTVIASDADITLYLYYSSGSTLSRTVTASGGNGTYLFDSLELTDGDSVSVYIDGSVIYEAVTVSLMGGSSVAGYDLYNDTVIVRSESASAVSNTVLNNADNGDTDIKYSVSGGNLSVDSGYKLIVWTGDTYAPGGNVTVTSADIQISGTMNLGSGSLSVVTSGTLDIDGTLTITSGSVTAAGNLDNSGILNLDDNSGSMDIAGNIVNSGTIDATGVSATVNLAGSWDNNGTFTSGSSTVIFDGTAAQSINSGGTDSDHDFNNITISNTSDAVSVSSENLKVTGTLEISSSAELSLDSGAQVWVSDGTFTETGDLTLAADSALINHNGITYDYYGGTTGVGKASLLSDFDGTDNVTVKEGNFAQDEAAAALSLTVDSGAVYTVTTGNLDVGGDVTVNGTLTGANTIYVGGDWDNNGTFTFGTSTVIFDGASAQTLDGGGSAFNSLTVADDAAVSLITNDLTVSGTLSIGQGTSGSFDTNSKNVTAGGITIASGGVLNLDGTSGTSTLTLNGNITNNGNLTVENSTNAVSITGNTSRRSFLGNDIDYNANSITLTSIDYDPDVNLSVSGDKIVLGDGNCIFDSVTIGTGTEFDAGMNNFEISGNFSNSGTYTSSGNTVTFTGGNTTLDSGSSSFESVIINKELSTNTLTLQTSDLAVSNILGITSGELVQGNLNITVSDTGSTGTAVTVGSDGTWSNTGDGDVTLGGDVSNTGTVSFDGATALPDGIQIRSTVDGQQRNWQGSGTFSMTDVDVKDQTAIGGAPEYITVVSGTDSGNNVNWLFSGIESIGGTAYSDEGSTVIASDADITLYLYYSSGSTLSRTVTASGGNGTYLFDSLELTDGDSVSVYIDGSVIYEAVTVSLMGGSSVAGYDLYNDTVIVRSESASAVSNTVLNNADNGDTDIKYSVSGGNLSVDSGYKLIVWTGDTYAPGGNVTVTSADIQISGTMNLGSGSLSVVTSGTLDIDGTLTITSGSVTAAGNLDNSGILNLDDNSGSMDIAGNIVNSGTIDATGVSATVNLAGSWDNNGTFTSGSSTVVFDGTSAQSINSGGTGDNYDFNNITISNTSDAVSVSSENLKVTGTLEISSSAELSLDSGAQVWVSDGTFTETGDLTLAADSALINHNGITYDYYGGTTGVGKTSLLSDFDGTDNVTVKEGNFAQDEAAAALSLTVDSGAVYTVTTGNLDVGGDVTVNGTLTGANTIYVGGDWDNNGTFTSGTSTVIFDGTAAQSINSGGTDSDHDFNNITISNTSDAVSVSSENLKVTGTLEISSSAELSLDSGAQVWVSDGTFTETGDLTLAADSALINHNGITYDYYGGTTGVGKTSLLSDFDGTDNVTVKEGNFAQDEAAAALSLTVDSGAVYTVTTGNLDVGGDVTVNGTLTGANTIYVGGDWDNNGTFTSGTSTVIFDGTAAQSINSGGTDSDHDFNNITISNTSDAVSVSSENLKVTGTLEISASAELSLDSGAQVWVSDGTFTETGDLTLAADSALINHNGITYDYYGGTTGVGKTSLLSDFDGTDNVTVKEGNFAQDEAAAALSLTVDSGAVYTVTTGNLDVGGDVTVNGTLTGANTIYVGGDWDNNGTFTSGTSTVVFDGASAQTLDGGGSAFNSLTVADDAAVSLITNDLTVSGTLSIGQGTSGSFDTNSKNVTAGGITIASGGVLNLDGTSGTSTLTLNGNITNNGNLTVENSTNAVSITGNTSRRSFLGNDIDYNANSITLTSIDYDPDVNLSVSGDKIVLGDGNCIFDSVTIGTGTEFDAGMNNFEISGNFSNSGTYTSSGNTVTFTGGNTTLDSGSSSFESVIINKELSTNTLTLQTSDLAVSNILGITSGELVQGNLNITVSDTGSTGTAVTVGSDGTWSNTGDGDVTLGGDVSNTGTVSFDGATALPDGIQIRSTVDGQQRNWQGSGTFSMTDVDVKDQTAIGGAPEYITVVSGTDSGNNVNWLFSGIESIGGTAYSDEGSTVIASDADITLYLYYSSGSTLSRTVTASGGNGTYLFDSLELTDGDSVSVYIDGSVIYEAVTVSLMGGSSVAGYDLYNDTVIVRSESASAVSNTVLNNADNGDTDIKYSVSGGNLSVDSGYKLIVWTGDTYAPGGNVTVTSADIQISGTMNLGSGSLSVVTSGTLDIDGTLTITSGSVTAAGNLDNSGILNLDDNSGSMDIAGNIVNSGTIDATGVSATVNLAGSWDNNGTFTSGSSTVVFDGTSAQSINSGGTGDNYDFNNITISNTSDAVSVSSENLKVTGTLEISASAELSLDSGAQVWVSDGTFTETGDLTLAADSALINHNGITYDYYGGTTGVGKTSLLSDFDGTDNVTVKEGNFAQDEAAAALSLTVDSGAVYTVTTGNLDVGGDVTVNGTLTGANTIYVGGDWDNNGTFTSGTSTVIFDGTAAQSINSGGTDSDHDFNNITISNTSDAVSVSSENLKVTGTLEISSSAELSLDSGAQVWVSDGTFTETGDLTLAADSALINHNGITYDYYGGTTGVGKTSLLSDFDGTDNVTVKEGNFAQDEAAAALSLTVDSGAVYTVTTGNLDVGGDVTVNGTLTGANTIYVGGDWDNNGTFTSGTSTVIFDGTAAQSINSGGTGDNYDFNNITISNTSDAVSVSSENLKVTGTLEISASAELSLDSGAQVWVSDGTFTETGDLTLAADSALINHNGITYDYYGGTTGVGKTSLLSDFDGTDNVTVKEGNFAQDEAAAALSLTVDSGAVYTVTTGNLDVGGDVTVNGTLTGANTIYVGGDWDNNGTFTSGTSTVIFDGTAAQSINSGGTDSDHDFNNITISNTSDAVSVSSENLKVTGTLEISASAELSLDSGAQVWVSDGTFTETGDLTLAADSALINHNGITYDYYGGTTGVGKTSLLSDFDGTDNVTVKEGNFAQDEAAAALSLTVDSGAVYTVTTGNLDVGGDVTVNGTLTGANTIYVGGDWDNNGTFTFGTSTVIFDGTAAQSINSGGTGDNYDFNNITISNTSDAVSVSSENLKVTGTLEISSSAELSLDSGAQVWVSDGTFTETGDLTLAADSALINHNGITYDYYGGTTGVGKTSLLSDFDGTDNVTVKEGNFAQDEAAAALSLTVDSGAVYTVTTGNLDVGGDVTVNGTLTGANTIYVGGDWDNNGTFTSGTSTVIFDGTAAQSINSGGTDSDHDFNNITISNTSDAVSVSSENLKVTGTLEISASAELSLDSGAQVWVSDGTFTETGDLTLAADSALINHNGITYDYYGGTTGVGKTSLLSDFDGTDNVTVKEGNFAQDEAAAALSLTVDSGAVYTVTTGNLDVGGDVTVNGTLTGANTIYVGGDWDSNGTFNHNNCTVIFDGTSEQQITSSGNDFFNVTINNTEIVTLMDNMQITGELVLTDGTGLLDTNGNGLIVTGSIRDDSGGENFDSDHMIIVNGTGYLQLNINAIGSYLFPVGTGSDVTSNYEYSPITVELTSGTISSGAYIRATAAPEKFDENPSTINYLNRYWNTTSNGLTAFSATITCNYVQDDVVGIEEYICGTEYESGNWTGQTLVDSLNHNFTIAGITSFAVFTGINQSYPSRVVIIPETSQTITAGDTIQFAAKAYDQFDNLITEDANDFIWANATDSGLFNTTTAGSYTVTATYTGVSSVNVSVTVSPGAVGSVSITPSISQTITSGNTVQFTASAYDVYNNLITNTTTDFTWTNTTSTGLFNKTIAGTYTVNADYNGILSASVAVTVNAKSSPNPRPDINNGMMINDGTQYQTDTSMFNMIDSSINNSIDADGIELMMNLQAMFNDSVESVGPGSRISKIATGSDDFVDGANEIASFTIDSTTNGEETASTASSTDQEFSSEYEGISDMSFYFEDSDSLINFESIAAYKDRHPLFKTELELILEKI